MWRTRLHWHAVAGVLVVLLPATALQRIRQELVLVWFSSEVAGQAVAALACAVRLAFEGRRCAAYRLAVEDRAIGVRVAIALPSLRCRCRRRCRARQVATRLHVCPGLRLG